MHSLREHDRGNSYRFANRHDWTGTPPHTSDFAIATNYQPQSKLPVDGHRRLAMPKQAAKPIPKSPFDHQKITAKQK